MKIINKILIPSLAITSMATTTICACSCNQDKKQPLSSSYLDIRDNTLYGFKEEYKFKESIKKGHYKLSIPVKVNKLDDTAFALGSAEDGDSQLLIEAIDFVNNCPCTSFGTGSFLGCENLETVIFPPKFNEFGAAIFMGCDKLTTLDISNIEDEVTISDWYTPARPGWSTTGKIIYNSSKSNQVKLAQTLLDLINFEPVTGDKNQWTLETK